MILEKQGSIIMVNFKRNYQVYLSISNFETRAKELNFDDFKIISIEQGSEAKEWIQILGGKGIPSNILIKEFPNYIMKKEDDSGFDEIYRSMDELLLVFRLYKVGDIMFDHFLIKNIDNKEEYSNLYDFATSSVYKYKFEKNEIAKFNDFRKNITEKRGYNNRFYKLPLEYFISGGNKRFSYRIENLERIIDYIIALEALFLIDGNRYFLRRTISKRISNFLKIDNIDKIIKYMYDERSRIVHGNYIILSENKKEEKIKKLKCHMPLFEELLREIFIKIFDYTFSSREKLIKFMKELYDIPEECIKVMESAKKEAEKYFLMD